MAPPNTAQTRVADPVLTTIARGYRNGMHVGEYLFPKVPVMARAGFVVEFNAEQFLEIALERAPGETRRRIHFGHSGKAFALVQRAEDGVVPREQMEEAEAVPGIRYSRIAARKGMEIISLQIEIACATLATTATNYSATHTAALAGADRWDGADSQPAKAVETRKETIAQSIGMEPNVMIVGTEVHRALKNNPDVIDRVKHTEGLTGSIEPVVTHKKLAQYFDVEHYMVGTARKGTVGNFVNVWGKNVVLAYSELASLEDMGSPSFGYCYQLNGYPIVEPGWFDDSVDSWIYKCTTEATPVIAGKDAGFLFTTVVG